MFRVEDMGDERVVCDMTRIPCIHGRHEMACVNHIGTNGHDH